MKMILWKELRENAKWAALGGVCLLLAELFALASSREGSSGSMSGVTLCSDGFLLVSVFGCAAIGAGLGALQILPELRRDQWASLLHRPVRRRVIFLGKAAAGTVLHLLAAGLPLLVSTLFVAWPGQFAAPFVPGLAIPAASDVLLGLAFYFLALLLALQPGRWFGARGAIALCGVAMLVVHLTGSFPFAVPLIAAALLGAAAAGAMLGSVRRRSWAARLALAVVISLGTLTAVLLAIAVASWRPQGTMEISGVTELRIASDGTVLLAKQTKEGASLTDMAGNVVTDERYAGNSAENRFLYPYPFVYRHLDALRRRLTGGQARASRSYVELVRGDYSGTELWYLIPGKRSYFAGYDKLSARRIGICDATGFHEPSAVPRPFASQPQSSQWFGLPYLAWIDSQLYAFDFADRKMTPLLDAGSAEIYSAVYFPAGVERPRIAVALTSEIRILDGDGAPLFTLPYGRDLERWPQLGITATSDYARTFIQYSRGYFAPQDDPSREMHLEVIGAKGERVQSHSVEEPVPRIVKARWAARLLRMPIASLFPALGTPNRSSGLPGQRWIPGGAAPVEPGDLAALFALAAALGLAAFFWARRAALSASRTAIWIALTLLFGVTGFLAFRLFTDWPTLVRCPRCAHPRPARAAHCPRCAAAWEPPPATGAEIFEPA